MDSISQIALGAATGEIATGKKAGNKALIWGAVGGTIPDLDVLAAPFLDPISNLVFHRGFTHSFWFAFLMAPVLGFLLFQFYKKRSPEVSYKDWTLLFFLSLFTHPLLDCFTTWGTQFFYPFSDYRVAFNTIFVVDPFYTVPFIICLGILAFLKRNSNKRRILNTIALSVSTLYLAFTVWNKFQVDHYFEKSLDKRKANIESFMSAPTPMNNLLWYATAQSEDSIWVGYQSILDKDRANITFQTFNRNLHLGKSIKADKAYQILRHVSNDFYILRKAENGVYFYDLRFGLMDGWQSKESDLKLPFYWYLSNQKDENGDFIVEQKRSSIDINQSLWQSFLHRIKGNKL